MPKVYVLVGVPGSGKSTWIKNTIWTLGLTIISTDAFVEDYARAQGKTYNEVFKEYMPTAIDLMIEQVVFAREHGHTVIWDQTSTTVKSRKKKFNMLPDYEHIAVVFKTPNPLELAIRLKNRPGKNIPQQVINSMISGWEEPTLNEGYAEVWNAS